MKLFHDDNRFPPDDTWEWAKTNADALDLLQDNEVQVISIDMDLGAVEGKDFNYGSEQGRMYRGLSCRDVNWLRNMNNDPGENGVDLATKMVEMGLIPPRIIIHTWNHWGAGAIVKCFADGGVKHAETIFWSGTPQHQRDVYGATL